jgi:phosphoribosyl-ATP pyrophosphohydrolase
MSESPGYSKQDILNSLEQVLRARQGIDPSESYVSSLYAKGLDHILKKVGEESAEVIIAAKGGNPTELVKEVADLWFHCMVLLVHSGLSIENVFQELDKRFGMSGLEEKARRVKP